MDRKQLAHNQFEEMSKFSDETMSLPCDGQTKLMKVRQATDEMEQLTENIRVLEAQAKEALKKYEDAAMEYEEMVKDHNTGVNRQSQKARED